MPQKILIVEDDADWQARIRERLEGLGYDVALASSALEARVKTLPNPQDYALILLDPSLSKAGDDRDGLAFLDQVREQGVQTPCVLLTGNLTKSLARTVLGTSKYKVSAALEKSDFVKDPALVTKTLQEAMKLTESPVPPPVRPIGSYTTPVQVTVFLERDVQGFTSNERASFIFALARLLNVKTDQIRIVRIESGSIKITLEMSEEVAQSLISMYLAKDAALQTLHITKVEPSVSTKPPTANYRDIALLTIVSTVALIAVLGATVAAVSWLLQNAGGAVVVVLLALVAVILLFYVLNLWIAIFAGRIKGKTARKMGRDALAKIPILGPLLIHPSQEDDNSE